MRDATSEHSESVDGLLNPVDPHDGNRGSLEYAVSIPHRMSPTLGKACGMIALFAWLVAAAAVVVAKVYIDGGALDVTLLAVLVAALFGFVGLLFARLALNSAYGREFEIRS